MSNPLSRFATRVLESSSVIEDLWTDHIAFDLSGRVIVRLKTGVSVTYAGAPMVVVVSTAVQMGLSLDWWIVPFDFATAEHPAIICRNTEWHETSGIAIPKKFDIPLPPFLRSSNLIRL